MTEAQDSGSNDTLRPPQTVQIPVQTSAASAPDEQISTPPAGPATTRSPADHRPRRRVWIIGTAALLLGLAAGAGIGIAATRSDPTQSKQYRALQASVSSAQDQEEATKESFGAAQRSADASLALANQDLAQQQAAIATSQAAVASSAAAMSQAQAAIDANSITEGTWTVGSDIQPGRYRTSAPVSEGCYWEIDRSGTNGSSIVQNDLPTGGYPTITLSVGQDFTTKDCGNWLKQ